MTLTGANFSLAAGDGGSQSRVSGFEARNGDERVVLRVHRGEGERLTGWIASLPIKKSESAVSGRDPRNLAVFGSSKRRQGAGVTR